MNKISVGDVYYLKSPFTSSVDKEHAKRVAYLLGTVPSRPALVVRAPVPWDTYGEVMIVPAIHKETEPGVKIKAYDRFGYEAPSTYNFTVHTQHSIPVNRLGSYIGHLTDDEMLRIRNCMQWITDGMPMGNIPEDYRGITTMTCPLRPRYRKDTFLSIDQNMRLLQGDNQYGKFEEICELDIDFDAAISPAIAEQLQVDDNFKIPSKKSGCVNAAAVEHRDVDTPTLSVASVSGDTINTSDCKSPAYRQLTPYLTETNIINIPKHLENLFLDTPKYLIKNMYHGRRFEVLYKNVTNKIKRDRT